MYACSSVTHVLTLLINPQKYFKMVLNGFLIYLTGIFISTTLLKYFTLDKNDFYTVQWHLKLKKKKSETDTSIHIIYSKLVLNRSIYHTM